MSIVSFIANRFIKQKKSNFSISFLNGISVAGTAIGVAIVILAITILDGFEAAVSEKIVQMNSHIKITAFGKRDLLNSESFISSIKSNFGDDIKTIYPFIQKEVLIKSKYLSDGVTILGITEEQFNNIREFISRRLPGKNLMLGNNQLIIGRKLAERLFIEAGDKITLFGLLKVEAPSENNPPIIEQFVVEEIFESGMSDYDDLKIYANIQTVQNMFETDGAVSGYDIQLLNVFNINAFEKKLKKFLNYPYYVRSIYKVHQNIFTWLELQKKPIPIILGLIIFVAVFNMVSTLLMLVLEKIKHIGILKSLGLSRKKLNKIFVFQGLFISIIGIVLGNILALTLSFLQLEFDVISLPQSVYFLSSVPIKISLLNNLIVSSAAFLFSILAVIIPSRIASKINTISIIRFQ